MKLGELLVRHNKLSSDELEMAMAKQASDGGKLGSLLVEEQKIDAETLTVFLGLELGIPVASGATLERCKRSAVQLLTPAQAAQHRCIPIVIQEQTLIVAVNDPHDVMTLDALSTLTGYRIIPRVAPEIRVLYYLEKYYGIPRPKRFAILGDSIKGERDVSQKHRSLPRPPLPGLPPKSESPVDPQTPPITIKTKTARKTPLPGLNAPRATPPPPPTIAPAEQLEQDASELSKALEEDTSETASATSEHSRLGTGKTEAPVTSAPDFPHLSFEEALKELEGTVSHGDISTLLLRASKNIFETAVVCLVRDSMLFGWKGFGPGLTQDRVDSILIPLDSPSIFQEAIDKNSVYSAKAFPTTINNHWFKVLQTHIVDRSYVAVIRIGSRPVNVIYGHLKDGKDASEDDLREFGRVVNNASVAYINLISNAKSKTQ